MSNDVFKISELNQFIKDVITTGFPQALWVCGEIQGYDRNKDKSHVFFELVEKDPSSKDIMARVGLVIFANRKFYIDQILKRSENAFALKDDIEVKFLCKVDFYSPHGAVRLVIESIDPTYTLGKIAQEKQKLIAFLKEKGTLDKNKALELPLVPLKVGLITAYDSAAYNDFCSELEKSKFSFIVYLRNTVMQGKKTEGDVCKAIDELSKIKQLDCIVITRGGGSIADLSCFDSQSIAEKIALCRLPVLSGIGHEINTTITDLAAHTFAKTPTAIAQFFIGRVQQYLDNLDAALERIIDLAQLKLEGDKQALKSKAYQLQQSTTDYLKTHREHLGRFNHFFKFEPGRYIKESGRRLLEARRSLKKIVEARLTQDHKKLLNYTKMVDMLSPVNTMKRGFSVARTRDGKVIKSVKGVKNNDVFTLEVFDGKIQSVVKDTQH